MAKAKPGGEMTFLKIAAIHYGVWFFIGLFNVRRVAIKTKKPQEMSLGGVFVLGTASMLIHWGIA